VWWALSAAAVYPPGQRDPLFAQFLRKLAKRVRNVNFSTLVDLQRTSVCYGLRIQPVDATH
jgi:hypothetical protein